MNRIDLTNLGGFPLEQDTLKFMQDSYSAALSAIAKLCGNKTILYGVEVVAGNVTPGWISYNDELILFQGGVAGTDVVITETPTQISFEDETTHDAYFINVAQCGVGGAFPFADLIRLSALQNMWLPGDIKERYCDAAYIAANFDVDGYGLNQEKGWRILSKAYPDTAGKVMVNLNTEEEEFNEVGKTGGLKTHTLLTTEIPAHNHAMFGNSEVDTPLTTSNFPQKGDAGDHYLIAGSSTEPTLGKSGSTGGGGAHNNLQPYCVILKLVKL